MTANGPPYDTPTGRPCPRCVRADGAIDGDGACHACGLGSGCPLFDPWSNVPDDSGPTA